MTYDTHKYPGHDCPPEVNPADQPKPPGDKEKCETLPPPERPTLKDPEKCPDPDPCCKCPPAPSSNCLEDLITQQAPEVSATDQTKFKKELAALLDTAKKASQDYSRDKYDDLLDRWLKIDAAIAELIRKLECAVWCWHCILDCYVCPLLYQIHDAEKRLYDDGKLPTDLHDLYDLQYWLTRDRDAKDRQLTRIKTVLKAWETPATTIDKALNDNKALVESIGSVIGTQPGKAVYDVFFRLVPLHLAIAPPKTPKTTTKIDKKYTEFCDCDQGTPDDCCGPDVGERSLRQRLLPPQPYLIDPNQYFQVICCIVEKRLIPANDQLTDAEKELAKVNTDIERYKKAVAEGWQKEFEKNAKAAIPSVIDCCDYEADKDESSSQAR